MAIKAITTADELQPILEEKKVTIIKFYADWCGPCQMQAPMYENFVKTNEGTLTDVNFVEANIDQAQEVAAKYGVQSIPTFVILKGTEKVTTLTGIHGEDQLKEKVEEQL